MDIIIDKAVWICLAVAVLAAAATFWSRFLPVWLAGSAVKYDSLRPTAPETLGSAESYSTYERTPGGRSLSTTLEIERRSTAAPLVSVIVYAFTKEEELVRYLEKAMDQDYPNYEVILVNEGSAEPTAALSERLLARWPKGLYVTFIPHESQNLSRRKLAQTIGFKAAKGDVVITTMSNCVIPSRGWVSAMMAPFLDSSEVDVVLGYTHVDFSELRGAARWYRGMDATLTACQWIGSAEQGRPYRGDGANLAFHRRLFFDTKGYSRTIHLMNGDDDIFLHQIMHPGNTRTAISPSSILTTCWEESAGRVLSDLKERYAFTSRYLPRWPFVRAAIGSAAQWVLLLAVVAAYLLSFLPMGAACDSAAALTAAAAGGTLLLVTWVAQISIYRRAARRLESVCLWWALPWFLLWLPLGNMFFRWRTRRHARKNYTFA